MSFLYSFIVQKRNRNITENWHTWSFTMIELKEAVLSELWKKKITVIKTNWMLHVAIENIMKNNLVFFVKFIFIIINWFFSFFVICNCEQQKKKICLYILSLIIKYTSIFNVASYHIFMILFQLHITSICTIAENVIWKWCTFSTQEDGLWL